MPRPRTNYALYTDEMDAAFLGIKVEQLRALRRTSAGPKFFQLPTGQVRYRCEDLDEWAFSANAPVLHVWGNSDVVALPNSGVTVRRMLNNPPPKKPPYKGKHRSYEEHIRAVTEGVRRARAAREREAREWERERNKKNPGQDGGA